MRSSDTRIFRWLMVFAESELAFTDTSEAQDESKATTFALFGFGGGVRGTIHATERVAFFLQGSLGWLEAMVPHGTLQNLGYTNAEGLSLGYGGRTRGRMVHGRSPPGPDRARRLA